MVQWKLKKEKERVAASLSGDAVIENAGKLRNNLLLVEQGPLLLNLDGVTRADLSFIQILVSLLKNPGPCKKVTLKMSRPDNPVMKVILAGGFAHHPIFSPYVPDNQQRSEP